jgi:endonuclease/exonuclease/phosphatase family metal-dependent hydrolase
MNHFSKSVLVCSVFLLAGCASAPDPARIRVATFNVSMGLAGENDLAERLASENDPGLAKMAEILQRVRPDIILLNEFDYTPGSAALLRDNYLLRSWSGQAPLSYASFYLGPVNTGVDSGLDLNGNQQTGEPADAWGFGQFPGQYGMLVMSRFPLVEDQTRTFRNFPWQDMPGALRPLLENGSQYYPESVWAQLKLSSKSHWDLVYDVHGASLHFLVSHPTPPVFDGPEDRNGRRNHDEIRMWADYVGPGTGDYLVDDEGRAGGLQADDRFVIAGDLNADPFDGDSTGRAIMQLLDHPRVDSSCVPRSRGGLEAAKLQGGQNVQHRGDPAADTADFNDERLGNIRIDYVLPSAGLKIAGCGVYWPASDEAGHDLIQGSDHRMVWIDLEIPTGDQP